MTPTRVTVDTNILDPGEIECIRNHARDAGLKLDITVISASARERGEFDTSALHGVPSSTAPEPMVWGESRWGEAAWAANEPLILDDSSIDMGVLSSLRGRTRFEAILAVITSGSLRPPGGRDALTEPQRRQLRDAMILEAHARDGRDVFVTRDSRGFIKHGKREALQALCSTEIVHPDEFADYCRRRAASQSQQ